MISAQNKDGEDSSHSASSPLCRTDTASQPTAPKPLTYSSTFPLISPFFLVSV